MNCPGWLRLKLTFVALFALACSTSATFVVQQYDGAPRSPERIAVLRLNAGEPTIVVTLDDERLDYAVTDADTRVHIEMLPGKHELNIGHQQDSVGVQRVVFVAKPGRVYRIIMRGDAVAVVPGEPPSWVGQLYEVDRDTDDLLALALPPTGPSPGATTPVASAVPAPTGAPGAPQASGAPTTVVTAPPPATPIPSASVAPPLVVPAASTSSTPIASASGAPPVVPGAPPSDSGSNNAPTVGPASDPSPATPSPAPALGPTAAPTSPGTAAPVP